MKLHVPLGQTNYSVVVFIQDSSSTTGEGLAGLDDTKVDAYYWRINTDNDIEKGDVGITDLVAITSDHTDGGFIEIDATNLPGLYRLDLPDALFADGNWSSGVRIYDAGSNDVADCVLEFQLVSATRGLAGTALPDAAAEAAGGLYTRGSGAGQINQAANGQINANSVAISGSTTAADNLEMMLLGAVTGAVIDASATTTSFTTGLTESTDDHYNGSFLLFTSGALTGQSRKISDYTGSSKTITLATALTEAPANGVSFVILGRSE